MHGFLVGLLAALTLLIAFRAGRRVAFRRAFGHHGFGRGHGCGHGGGVAFGYHGGCHGRRGGGFGEADERPRGGVPRGVMRMVFQRLQTTPGQERELFAAIDELQAALRPLKEELAASKSDIAAALRSVDGKLSGTFGRHDEKLAEGRAAFEKALARIHAALEPAQREQLADLLGKLGWGRF